MENKKLTPEERKALAMMARGAAKLLELRKAKNRKPRTADRVAKAGEVAR